MKENDSEIGYTGNDYVFNNGNEDNTTPMELDSDDQVVVPDFDLTDDTIDEDLCEVLGSLVPESLENFNFIADSGNTQEGKCCDNSQISIKDYKNEKISEKSEKTLKDNQIFDFIEGSHDDVKPSLKLDIDDSECKDDEILDLKSLSPCSVILHNSINLLEIVKCTHCKHFGNIDENLNIKYEVNDVINFDNSDIKEEKVIEREESSQLEKSNMYAKYECEICHEQFTNKRKFGKHTRTHNNGYQPIEKSNTSANYICEICHENLKNRKYFDKHMRNHEKGYQCDVCKKPFSCKSGFLSHFKGSHVKKLYYCCFCNEAFEEEDELLVHLPIHFEGA